MGEKGRDKQSTIEKHIEYNNYIRDFFFDDLNHGRKLDEAILCYKHKVKNSEKHVYDREDLSILNVEL